MKFPEGVIRPTTSDSRYRNLSLMKLVKKIVEKSDRRGLQEFHNNRALFRYNGGSPLRIIEYLNELRESAAKRVWSAPNAFEVADRAYDLTIDKFNNFPGKNKSSFKAKNKTGGNMKRKGADCRLYFNAFLKRAAWSFATEPPSSHIEEEARAAIIMQGLVRRHFYRSLLEAERQANPFRSRYNWRVRGRTICVWLPVSLVGRERREWLEKNIDNPNPFREGERERVQAIVYSKLVRERSVDYTEDTDNSSEEKNLNGDDSGEIFTTSLAEVIAKEKARNIQLQRRSIKALGEERLRQLILRIFENLNCGEYEDGKVARDFGIAKATFSRFAGSRWFQKASAIPDLWRNTAEVLSENPIFEEVAKSAGVWEEVQNTLKMGDLQKGGESQPCLKTCIFYLK